MNNTNLVPLDIDGRPLYALDQTELRFLRTNGGPNRSNNR